MRWPNIFLTFIAVIEHSEAITSLIDALVPFDQCYAIFADLTTKQSPPQAR